MTKLGVWGGWGFLSFTALEPVVGSLTCYSCSNDQILALLKDSCILNEQICIP